MLFLLSLCRKDGLVRAGIIAERVTQNMTKKQQGAGSVKGNLEQPQEKKTSNSSGFFKVCRFCDSRIEETVFMNHLNTKHAELLKC